MAEVILLSGGENDLITHYVALHEFIPLLLISFLQPLMQSSKSWKAFRKVVQFTPRQFAENLFQVFTNTESSIPLSNNG